MELKLIHESLKIIGLSPFVFILVHSRRPIQRIFALLIVINGILCHAGELINYSMWRWDLLCNTVMIIITNLKTKWAPQTFALTLIAIVLYLIKIKKCRKGSHLDPLIHILGVQFLLSICLHHL